MTPTLKPCPFCGFVPSYSPKEKTRFRNEGYYPEQVQCSCCNIIFRTGERGCTDAVHSWNHRVNIEEVKL